LDPLRGWFVRQEASVKLALIVGALLRAWFAITDHSVFWPDEIYQSIEPAHRVAFGYGLLPWEFRDGARSWFFPALLALPLKLLGLFHVHSGLVMVCAVRLLMVAVGVFGLALGIEYARRLGGKAAALIAAFALALFPPLLAYSHRTSQEVASAPLVMLVPLLLVRDGRRSAALAGFAVGVATLLRFQCAIIAGVFFVGFVFRQRWDELKAYSKACAAVAVAGGVLDWMTWGRPFHSFITYFEFNLRSASMFGVAPPGFFLTTLWTSSGPAVALVIVGVVAAVAGPARTAAAAVGVFVLLHSAIPHKEFRFLSPVFPLMLSVGAIGLAALLARAKAPAWSAGAAAALVSLGFARSAHAAHYANFGQYAGTERAHGSVWDSEEEPNLLLSDAGERADTCGVLLLGIRAAFTGGYSYLHRHVPVMYRFQACNDVKAANYVIAARADTNVPPEYELVESRDAYGLYRREGKCEPPADFSDMLDGSEDMGFARAPIQQPDSHELRISAGSSASAFVRGFSNGEHAECKLVRWAVGTSSRMAFPLDPERGGYSLSFTAEPYGRALPQHVRVTLNDHRLADFPMEEGWHGYQAFVPARLLKHGENTIDFAFARAVQATGEDKRVLAVLFDQITLSPAETSLALDIGTPEARRYLASGFSGDEQNADGTFAWSEGPKSELVVTLPDAPDATVLEVKGLAYHALAPLEVAVGANGKPVGSFRMETGFSRAGILLPRGSLTAGTNKIDFTYARTTKASEHEPGSSDDRELAMLYDRILIAPLPVGLHVDFGTESAHPFMAEGFSVDEADGARRAVWSDGPHSKLWFQSDVDGSEGCALRLVTTAYAPALPLSVEVKVNGHAVGEFTPTSAWETQHIALPASVVVAGTNTVEFAYSHVARPRDVAPPSKDGRELAVRFDKADIECGGGTEVMGE
jgi:hypothetical protein